MSKKITIIKRIRSISFVLMLIGYGLITYLSPTEVVYANGSVESIQLVSTSYIYTIISGAVAVGIVTLIFIVSSIYIYRMEE